MGGNGQCHHVRLDQLDKRVILLERENIATRLVAPEMKPVLGRAPFLPGASVLGSSFATGAKAHDAFNGVSGAMAAPADEPSRGETPGPLDPRQPTKGRAIGVLASDKLGFSFFSEKLTQSDGFKFDGVRNGAT